MCLPAKNTPRRHTLPSGKHLRLCRFSRRYIEGQTFDGKRIKGGDTVGVVP